MQELNFETNAPSAVPKYVLTWVWLCWSISFSDESVRIEVKRFWIGTRVMQEFPNNTNEDKYPVEY